MSAREAPPSGDPARFAGHGGVWEGPEERAAIREHELAQACRAGFESGLLLGLAMGLALFAALLTLTGG